MAERMEAAGHLATALEGASAYARYRVIGDTVVRCAIQHAHRQLELESPYGLALEQCDEILRETLGLMRRGIHGPLGYRLPARVRSRPSYPWIWDDRRVDDVFAEAFRVVVENNYGAVPCALDDDEVTGLRQGIELLLTLLPSSARSALSHTHLVAVFAPTGPWSSRSSSSEYTLSGTVFLNRRLLANPWWVAEYVYHETLHQQLYDFRQGHLLLSPDFDRRDAPTVCSLWNLPGNGDDNYWDVHRSLAAFHVYVHLSLLGTAAEQRAAELEPVYGQQTGAFRTTPRRTALARAQYLGEQLREHFWDELDVAGKRLVDWFATGLDVLDPAPPPAGASVHLLLDRYGREVGEIALLFNRDGDGPDVVRPVLELLRSEAASVRRVLETLGAQSELRDFETAVAPLLREEAVHERRSPADWFAASRSVMYKTILAMSPDGYTLDGGGPAERLVTDMVEGSSTAIARLVRRSA